MHLRARAQKEAKAPDADLEFLQMENEIGTRDGGASELSVEGGQAQAD